MKKIIFILLILLSANAFSQSNHDLTVKISGYKHLKGNIFIAVYNNAENYMNISKASLLAVFQPKALTDSYTFRNVPDGEYAATFFYDENGNGKLDTNFFGIPKEKNGFSNNAKGFFGPAKFDKAKFVHKTNQEISVTLE
jgi:uncharacterized protein (DUF2141 family)